MKNKKQEEVKIKIDAHGNVQREVIDQTQDEVRKPRFLGKFVPPRTA